MRNLLVLLIIAMLPLTELTLAAFQTQNSAQEKAAGLRAQLAEVETKQAELQARLQKLDESMKPENIEQNLAGIGSTKPEDLREQRRKQLEIERNGVQRQIDLLNTSHTRLETAIAQADAQAYRQSAAPVNAPSTTTGAETDQQANTVTPPTRPRRVRKKRSKRTKRHHPEQMFRE